MALGPQIDNPLYELLARTEKGLATLAVSGLANAGPVTGLEQLAGDLATAGLGKLGDRLRAMTAAGDASSRTAAWATAWAAAGLARTRLVKAQSVDPGDVVALPQSPTVFFHRPSGGLESMEELLAALQDPAPLLRAYAAGRLVEFGDEAVPGLLRTQQECGRCIRFLCIEALGRIGTRSALEGLMGLLGDKDVARPVEEALLNLPLPVVPALAAVLRGRTNPEGRPFAAKLLWRLGETELLSRLSQDDDFWVTGYALAATRPADRMAEPVEQERGLDRLAAAVALLEAGSPLLGSVRSILERAPKNRLANAATVLWHTSVESSILAHSLEQMTTAPHKQKRERAAALVGYLGHPAAVERLLRLLDAGEVLALGPLGEIAEDSATGPIIRAAQKLSFYQLHQVATALGRLGDPAGISFLLSALASERDVLLSEVAERALLAIGDPAAGPVGRQLLASQSTQKSLTMALALILAQIGTPTAKAVLARYQGGTDDMSTPNCATCAELGDLLDDL